LTLKVRFEQFFEGWGRFVYRRRWPVLILCILLNVGFGIQLPKITTDNSHESLLREDDPAGELYKEFRRQFGQDSLVMVAITPPEVFDFTFLEKLRSFHEEVETQLPHVADVTSLINARQTRGEGDTLIVEDLLETWPQNETELTDLKRKVLSNSSYLDYLISRDGSLTTVVIRPATYAEDDTALEDVTTFDQSTKEPKFLGVDGKSELVKALDGIVARYEGPDFPVYLSGGSVIGARLDQMMRVDVQNYMLTCGAVILVLLAILFRRISGVLFSSLIVLVSLVSTFGSMSLLGIPFSMTQQMLPVFVMCVAVCDAIHVLVLVYQRLATGSTKEEAIAYTFSHSGLAIVMTTLTTAAGMLSFVSAEIAPIAYLGILCALGVVLALFYTFTLLPAMLAITPVGARNVGHGTSATNPLARFLVRTGDFSAGHPGFVLLIAFAVLAWSLLGIDRLRFAHDPVAWFPDGSPVRVSLEVIDSNLGGSQSVEVLVDTGRENGLYEPATLQRFERAMERAGTLERGQLYVGKTVSLTEVVKETNRALHENQEAYYTIPDERDLVAQELLLFENSGSDDLETLTDSLFRTGRISLRVPMVDSVYYGSFLKDIKQVLDEQLGPDLPYKITGIAPLFGRIFVAMIHSMARSYIIALILITPLMIFLIGSLRIGLISMVPNLLPVLFVLGAMGWFDLPLDISTIVIGSILIGLAVDDTIHFMHRSKRNLEQGEDVAVAIHHTMETTGMAILFTSLVLGAGFFSIGSMATMNNSIRFGYLSALGIAAALVADLFMSPALLSLVMRKRKTKKT